LKEIFFKKASTLSYATTPCYQKGATRLVTAADGTVLIYR